MSEREQNPVSDDVLNLKLDHLQSTMEEVRHDVREIKDESPVLRIRQLEEKWRNLSRVAALLFIAVIGSYVTAWFTRS